MARGGTRLGAGRKKGSLTKRTQELVAKAADAGLLPLDYMLSILRDTTLPRKDRYTAAVDAAPYLHARLGNIKHEGDPNNPVQTVVTISWA